MTHQFLNLLKLRRHISGSVEFISCWNLYLGGGWGGASSSCMFKYSTLGFTICGILNHENKLWLSFSILFKQDESSPTRDDYSKLFSFQKAFKKAFYGYRYIEVIFKNWYIWNFSFKGNFLFGNTKVMGSSGILLQYNWRKIRYRK